MGAQTRKKNLSLFLLMFCLALPFLFIYYLSTDPTSERTQQALERTERFRTTRQIMTVGYSDQIVVMRNERVEVGRTALVFIDLKKNTIYLDLFLLDLDPQQPYAKEISKREAKKGFRLGENRFQLISVSSSSLVIKPDNS